MKVSVFGSGYVGLVMAACFAEAGHEVVCNDVDQAKVDKLQKGHIPIYEPGLEEVLKKAQTQNNIVFTTCPIQAVHHAEVIFIAVGTPQDEDGSADLQYVLKVAESIGQHMNDYKIVIDKSTVPVGTADKVAQTLKNTLAGRDIRVEFDVVSNPEFLREGNALQDFRFPDRIVIGVDNERPLQALKALYAPFQQHQDQLIVMDVHSAELTKYAANAMLATKISFMNEIANLAEKVGADVEKVRQGIGSDPRIGFNFINPGCGYGGSCFGKDVKALISTSKEYQAHLEIIQAVQEVNERQKQRLFEKIDAHFQGDLKNRTFAVWGLSFKPNTDDMRDAPSRALIEALWERGAKVQGFDPEAMDEAKRIYGLRQDFVLCNSHLDALEGADALVLLTEWPIFKNPDFAMLQSILKQPVIFDGRNIYEPELVANAGIQYYGIGR